MRCTGRLAPTVVAHRALRNPQQPSDVAVRTHSARQALDRHPILPAELGHPPPPSARTETEPCQGASRPGRCDASISVNRRIPVRTAPYGRMLGEAQRRPQAGRLPRERIWPARAMTTSRHPGPHGEHVNRPWSFSAVSAGRRRRSFLRLKQLEYAPGAETFQAASDLPVGQRQLDFPEKGSPDYARSSARERGLAGSAGFQPAGGPCGQDARAPRKTTAPESRQPREAPVPNLSFVRNQENS